MPLHPAGQPSHVDRFAHPDDPAGAHADAGRLHVVQRAQAVVVQPLFAVSEPATVASWSAAGRTDVFQFPSLRVPEAHDALKSLNVDIGVMAYVLQFAPDAHRAGLLFWRHEHGLMDKGPVLTIRYRVP